MGLVKPNFLGIGVIKSGTTWVAEILASHPQVFIAHGKELHYFSNYHSRGVEWYLEHFAHAKDELAVGEYSVSYMDNSEKNARRIHDFDPRMKLVVTLRHPVERAFSHYRWMRQFGYGFDSFESALKSTPAIIAVSKYFESMQPYWERFSDQQIHFVLHDDIKASPEMVQQQLFNFLEVDPEFRSTRSEKVIGKTIVPRSTRLELMRQRVHGFLKNKRMAFLITGAKKAGLSNLYRKINDDHAAADTLSSEQKFELMKLFSEDLLRFQDRTGLDVSCWSE